VSDVALRERLRIGDVALPGVLVPSLLFAGFAVLFWLLGEPNQGDLHAELARSFLAGHLWVPAGSHWELVPIDAQRAWSPFPPIPALTYIPFVVLGIDMPVSLLTAFVGAAGAALLYQLLLRLEVPRSAAFWITIGVIGSAFGWIASTGSLWFYPEVLGAVLTLVALWLAIDGRWPLVAGLVVGLAAGNRLPTGLVLPLILWFYRDRRSALAWCVAGVALVALPLAAYNVVRFGSPFEFGYGLIESFAHPGQPVTAEPYFRDGVLDLSYIPRSIGAMLLQGYEVRLDFPWLAYPISGVGIPLSAPTLLLALRARWSTTVALAWGTFVLIMLPNWAHGSWGFWQFSYRFITDAMAPIALLLAIAYRRRQADWLLRFTACFGLLALLYAFAAEFWWDARTIPPATFP
jgi:hypothetical protein